jgi:hypothetical protein
MTNAQRQAARWDRLRRIEAAATTAIPDLAECERILQASASPFAVLARQARERIERAINGEADLLPSPVKADDGK